MRDPLPDLPPRFAPLATFSAPPPPGDEKAAPELAACRVRVRELEWAESVLQAENRVLRMSAGGVALPAVLSEICRLLEARIPDWAAIVWLQRTSGQQAHAAVASVPPELATAMGGPTTEAASYPWAQAAALQSPTFLTDLTTAPPEPGLPAWQLVSAQGWRSCWCLPVPATTCAVLGCIVLFGPEPRGPTAHEQALAAGLAALAGASIERDHSDATLRASEEQFRRIFDSVPGMICTLGGNGEVEMLNRQVLDYFGRSLEELKNWAMIGAVHPDDLSRAIDELRHSVTTGEPLDSVQRLRRADGRYRWHHSRAVPTRDASGRISGWHMLITDVDDRKQAEQALRRSEAYLTEAQRLSHAGSFGWKVKTGELVWSAETYHILGYDSSTPPVLDWVLARAHPEDRARVQTTIDCAARDLSDVDFQHRLLMPDGDVKHLHVVARVIQANASDPEYIGVVMDITERQRLEDRLRSSERLLAEGQRLTKTGSWVLDFRTGKTDWSVETCRIFGFPDPPPSPHYSDFRARVCPEDRETVDRRLRESFESGESRPLEYVFILPDGTRKNIETLSQPVRDASGEVVRLMGTVMDVTERKQAEAKLRSAELLARGQLDALALTLDALARESVPDRLIEHVLRTILEKLEAHSVSAWERDEAGDWLELVAVIEEGRFQTRRESGPAANRVPLFSTQSPVWNDLFRTRQHAVFADIDQICARIRVGSDPECPWLPVREDRSTEPALLLMKQHLHRIGVRSVLFVPMIIGGKVAGMIGVRFRQQREFRPEQIELTRALAHQAMLAIQLTRLSAESRRTAVMAERNRMARDIHDTLAQGLTGVIVQLEAAADAATKSLGSEARAHLERASSLARESLNEARRSVRALRPQSLQEQTLGEALEQMIRKHTAGTTLRTRFSQHGNPLLLPAEWEENLLRIGQEVFTNALRHSRASEFAVDLNFEPHQIRLTLRDNGCGFDPQGRHDGFGLLGIAERVEMMGGRMELDSAPGRGAAVSIQLPLPPSSPLPPP